MRRRALAAALAGATAVTALAAASATASAGTPRAPHPRAQQGTAHVRTLHNKTSEAALDAYWTPERLRNAKPVPQPHPAAPDGDRAAPARPEGERTVVHGTRPKSAEAADGTKAAAEAQDTVGRLFFSTDHGDYVCSATVVTSENHSVLSTARHCGFGEGGSKYRFAPGYSHGDAPHGWWDFKSANWVSGGGQESDVAFLTMNENDNGRVQDAVGSAGIAFNQNRDQDAHILGLPADKDELFQCDGKSYGGPDGQLLMDGCDGMSGGASGGAWTVDDPNGGGLLQIGAYSGSLGDAAAAGYYDDNASSAYDGAQKG